MTTKRQFLDPIGAGCRFVLLKSVEPNTKLRITEHTVQVVPDSILEKLIYRPWVYRDSREDIAALYPVVVRFIELYLVEKSKQILLQNINAPTSSTHSTSHLTSNLTTNSTNVTNVINTNSQKTVQKNQNKQKHDDVFGFGIEDYDEDYDNEDEDEDEEEYDKHLEQNTSVSEITNNQIGGQNVNQIINQIVSEQKNDKLTETERCYNALKTIAQYMIEGMEELQKTYEYGNAVFALQYYIDLLQAGINGTYDSRKLPKHLTDFTSQNFLDNDKIKGLWKDKDIIDLAELLDQCFRKEITPTTMKAYRTAVESMLNDRDNIFKKMISSTNAS